MTTNEGDGDRVGNTGIQGRLWACNQVIKRMYRGRRTMEQQSVTPPAETSQASEMKTSPYVAPHATFVPFKPTEGKRRHSMNILKTCKGE